MVSKLYTNVWKSGELRVALYIVWRKINAQIIVSNTWINWNLLIRRIISFNGSMQACLFPARAGECYQLAVIQG